MKTFRNIFQSIVAFICLTMVMAVSAGCKSTADATAQTADSTMANATQDTTPVTKGEQIRLMVSLLSAGEGPDRQASDQMNKLMKDYSSQVNKPIQYAMVAWGREGEVDFCFRLTNLDSKQQKTFVDKMKQLFEGRALIFISENTACNHIR